MPRQPFLPTYDGSRYLVAHTALDSKPEFAKLVGLCIGIWSHVDNEMGTMFGLLLGLQSQAALEVFLSLRRASNQRDALSAVAKHRISDESKLAFDAILIVYKSLESQRNDLAHGCFGYLSKIDDALLWIKIEHYVHFLADSLSTESRGEFRSDRNELLKKNMFVYRRRDIEHLYSEMKKCWEAAFNFNCWLQHSTSLVAPEIGVQMFARLCALPQIRREMDRLRGNQEDTLAGKP
jgi:hypothetical protein